jgi:hypothetical protein
MKLIIFVNIAFFIFLLPFIVVAGLIWWTFVVDVLNILFS